MNLIARIQGLLRPAIIELVDDDGDQQRAQITLSKGGLAGVEEIIDKVPVIGLTGFYSNPPSLSECLAVFVGGWRSMAFIVGHGYRAGRPKGLKPGEAMMLNVLRSQYVELSDDGKIKSQAPDWQHDGDEHVSGTLFAAHVKPADGWTGTFATGDGRTAHVTNGIITNVA